MLRGSSESVTRGKGTAMAMNANGAEGVGEDASAGTPSAAAGTAPSVPAIHTSHLTKRYGKARGIEDVNLTVRQGEIFGFIGPNGAGKSTTIRTLLGLIRKTGGEASILGLDCERDRTRILEQVGYLPSEVFYYDGMRARDLLKYAASFYRVDCLTRARGLAARLGLDLDQKVEDMSLGNRKKVGIVQGLMHAPRLIILDEPTSGLDPLAQRAFFDLIREENRRGATVLFSSHILSEVQRICDRVGIIREGRLIAVRSVAEMRRSAVKRVRLGFAAPSDAGAARHALVSMTGVRSLAMGDGDGDGVAADGALGLAGNGVTGTGAGLAADAGDTGVTASFLYEGDCNALIAALAGLRLTDVEIMEPTLEEVFMHYYQQDGGAMDADAGTGMGAGRASAAAPSSASPATAVPAATPGEPAR